MIPKLDYYVDIRAYLKRVFLYRLKAQVLKTDLCKKIKYTDKAEYIKQVDGIIDRQAEELYFDLVNSYNKEYIEQAHKLNNASYKRIKRLKERITRFISMGECVFLTLTFKEEVLNDTNEKTRRKYVSRFLRTISRHYVANVDYGKTTEREHYHAIVVGKIRKEDLSVWDKSYGFTYIETVRCSSSCLPIAKYISKLTNHAIKETTKRHVYIFSRS